jgi:uncharacterized repeat protein (TIGR03803 family)
MNCALRYLGSILGTVTLGALTLAVLSALLLLAAPPAQAQTEPVLYNFCSEDGCADGRNPEAGLTSNGGNFYGTTSGGGAFGAGTVFELSPNGSGGWNEAVLYNFTGGADGRGGYSSVLFDGDGNLYGVTYFGGLSGCDYGNGCGVVFELSPVGSSWTETVLYTFCSQAGCADGEFPLTNLIMDTAGNLYGVTNSGGSNGNGTVFELSPSGGSWTEQVIYNVPNVGIGFNAGVAMDTAGNIYGATPTTVFELLPNGSKWNSAVLHTFTGAPKDGSDAQSTPVLDKAGNLYGATVSGGTKNFGTVYKLTPVTKGKKKGTWTEKILYSFKGGTKDGTNGGGIALDASGDIYGITGGGKYGDGTIFELAAADGKYKEKILWNFNNTDGYQPVGSLILDSSGNLYGATAQGGSNGSGVVFEVTP